MGDTRHVQVETSQEETDDEPMASRLTSPLLNVGDSDPIERGFDLGQYMPAALSQR